VPKFFAGCSGTLFLLARGMGCGDDL
jgi:hypothetical protein